MQRAEIQGTEVARVVSELLGRDVSSVERIGSGRNSRVYRLTCPGAGRYTAKLYYRGNHTGGDRLAREFEGLRVLWDNGESAIPRPIAADRRACCAVYEYIDGTPIPSSDVTEADIDYATGFLARLRDLSRQSGSDSLPPAAEACFSARGVVDNVRERLDRLTKLDDGGSQHAELRTFLADEVEAALEEVAAWCSASLRSHRMRYDSELHWSERTLSPSDFGFHNALRRPDGMIVFLDFEYFGWDDPSKMVSDFLLHPAMQLDDQLKRRFIRGVLEGFRDYPKLAGRIEALYPVFGLKWCLILLNEFAGEHLQRRVFASGVSLDPEEVRSEQLSKSRHMLQRVLSEYQSFPYHS